MARFRPDRRFLAVCRVKEKPVVIAFALLEALLLEAGLYISLCSNWQWATLRAQRGDDVSGPGPEG